MKRVLFIPDVHSPFEDRMAWRLACSIATQVKPDIVVVLGDFMDCYSVSRHSKNPERKLNVRQEIEAANARLDELDLAVSRGRKPNPPRKVFFRGNHEFRMEAFIGDCAPQLAGLLDLGELLGLRSRGWEDVAYRRGARIGGLYVTHDVGFAGARAHVQSREEVGRGIVIGHTHRMAMEFRESVGRKGVAIAAMMGTLASRDAIEYVHESKTHMWTLGVGVGTILDSGATHVDMVPFFPLGVGYEAVVFGQRVALA